METVDYVLPGDNLLGTLPDFAYLHLVPGMPKLRHIGQKTFIRLRRFQSLRKSGFAVPRFSEAWLLLGEQSPVVVWIDLARWTCRGRLKTGQAGRSTPRTDTTLQMFVIDTVLSLSSPPLRAERVTVFCFRLFRSLIPRSQKSKTKMGWGTCPNFFTISCAKPVGYSRSGEVTALVMSLRPDYQSRITSHGRASGLAMRLQDLFLILSQRIDLGLLSVAAAFRAARDFEKILGSGFEIIRIRIVNANHRAFFRVLPTNRKSD
jgi:hypothetical protein